MKNKLLDYISIFSLLYIIFFNFSSRLKSLQNFFNNNDWFYIVLCFAIINYLLVGYMFGNAFLKSGTRTTIAKFSFLIGLFMITVFPFIRFYI